MKGAVDFLLKPFKDEELLKIIPNLQQNETFDSAEHFFARSHFHALGCILLDLTNVRTPELSVAHKN